MGCKKSGLVFVLVVWMIGFSNPFLQARNTDEARHQNTILRIGLQDNDGFPLVMGTGADIGEPPGIGVDIMLRVAQDLGITLRIKRMPNKRVHGYLQSGFFDGSGFYSFKEERLKEGRFPMKDGKLVEAKRIDVISYHFYGLKGSKITWDGKNLTDAHLVGANMGYSVVGDLKALDITVNEAKTTRQNLDMLLKGRIQAYAAQDKTIDPVIASNEKYERVVKIGPAIKTKAYYFVFSHQYYEKHPEMAHKIWDRIEIVRDSVINHYKEKKISPRLY